MPPPAKGEPIETINTAIASVYVDQDDESSRKKLKLLKGAGRANIDVKDGGLHLPLGVD
jgi:hypothetical protein